MKSNKNNKRFFDEQSIDWLRGTKYLQELGMTIESIKQYHILCQQDGEDTIKQRYKIILKQVNSEKRVEFLKKINHEKLIISHIIDDSKNPDKKQMNCLFLSQ